MEKINYANGAKLSTRFFDEITGLIGSKMRAVQQELRVRSMGVNVCGVFSPFQFERAPLALYPRVTRPWGSDKYPESIILYNQQMVVLVTLPGVQITVLQEVINRLANTAIPHNLPRLG